MRHNPTHVRSLDPSTYPGPRRKFFESQLNPSVYTHDPILDHVRTMSHDTYKLRSLRTVSSTENVTQNSEVILKPPFSPSHEVPFRHHTRSRTSSLYRTAYILYSSLTD